MDALTVEGLPWSEIGAAVEAEYSRYFGLTLDFVKIAAENWPKLLAERGLADPVARARGLVLAEERRLSRSATQDPVSVAGSLGSVPATARLIAAVAKDGIVIKARARVTVRTNLASFVGGATEDTIVARVGEGIVSSIGSEQSYKDVLENPDRISKNVLAKGLDSNTAFEILSIDIADVDVGENVGAKLQAEQAESNKLVAQAQAEVRRAAAVAQEQEMIARVAEMQAKVVEAEAQVPLAMAEAFRSGNLGIMDYYRIKNLGADTDMRSKIAGTDESPDSGNPKK